MSRSNGNEKALDLRKIRSIVWKNWLVLSRDRMRLVPMLIFPIIMITIFGYTTTGTPTGIATAVVDYDHSASSEAAVAALRYVQTISIRYDMDGESEAMQLMDEGQIKALIIIPQGFGADLASSSEPAQVIVKVDESDSAVAQMARAAIQQAVTQMSRQQAAKKLELLQAQQNAASGAMGGTSAALEGLSAAEKAELARFSADSNSLRQAAFMLQQDMQSITPQVLALRNTLAVIETADNYFSAPLGGGILASLTTLSPFGGLSGNEQVLEQIQLLQLRKAQDARLIAIIGQLLAANAGHSAAAAAADGTAAAAGASLKERADAVDVKVSTVAFLDPVVYVGKPAYGQGHKNVDFLIPAIIALTIFQGATMGMGRALAGEKKDGSLTRVFLTPTSNTTILVGTALFYLVFETIRSSFLVFVAMLLFGVAVKGSILSILFIILLFAAGSTGVGLLISALTSSQEQYQAVAMLTSLPMMFLAGVFFPISTMPSFLQGVATLLPVYYAADALRGVMIKGFDLITVIPDITYLALFAIATIAVSIIVFKREIV